MRQRYAILPNKKAVKAQYPLPKLSDLPSPPKTRLLAGAGQNSTVTPSDGSKVPLTCSNLFMR